MDYSILELNLNEDNLFSELA